MKILLSGYHNPHFETVTEYTESALGELGVRLSVFDDRDFWFPGTVRERVGALRRWDLRALNRRLVARASAQRPDVCLVQGGHRIAAESLLAMKRMGVVTVLWTIDPPGSSGLPLDTAPVYDLVFCGGTEAVELLHAAGVRRAQWLPFACAPDRHVPAVLSDAERGAYASDVCFIGSYYPNRARLFASLTELKLIIRGPGWNRLPVDSPLRAAARDCQVAPSEWRKYYAAAAIVLAVHYQDGTSPCLQASPRIFEAMACGGFLLSDAQRDVATLFKDGEHLALFRTERELKSAIAHHLAHPLERERIAEQGRRETVNNHTYARRMEHLLSIVRTVQSRGPE